jgi:hypothetical protein
MNLQTNGKKVFEASENRKVFVVKKLVSHKITDDKTFLPFIDYFPSDIIFLMVLH